MGEEKQNASIQSGSPSDLGSAKAVGKTIGILEFLAERGQASLAEICSENGLNKSTGHRFLNALRHLGYARQVEDGSYAPTMKLAQLGMLVTDKLDLLTEARPVVQELANETQETIHLATIDETHLVYLDKVESTRNLRVAMMSRIGASAPTYCTGVGKALLAFVDEKTRHHTLAAEHFERHTPSTITDREALEKELARIRAAGVALDNEEHEIGVRCVAAPVLDPDGRAVVAISISAPSVRLTDDRIPGYERLLLEATQRLAARLFY
jgi:DNA-binding IclR family transcriptional regulator